MFDILNVLANEAHDMLTPKPKKGLGTSNFKDNAVFIIDRHSAGGTGMNSQPTIS
jgi:hypothetical protein